MNTQVDLRHFRLLCAHSAGSEDGRFGRAGLQGEAAARKVD